MTKVWVDPNTAEMDFTTEGAKANFGKMLDNPDLLGIIISPKYALEAGIKEDRGQGVWIDKRLEGLSLVEVLAGSTRNTHLLALDKRGGATVKKLLKSPALLSQILEGFYDGLGGAP